MTRGAAPWLARVALPLLLRLPPESRTRARPARPRTTAPAWPRTGDARPALGSQRPWPAFRASHRTRGGLRQEWRLPRCAGCARLQPHRSRHGHAAAAAGQPAAAAVPAAQRAGADQSHGLQQSRRGPRRDAACAARSTAASAASASARTRTRRWSARPTTTWPACGTLYAVADYFAINVSSPNTPRPARTAGHRRAGRHHRTTAGGTRAARPPATASACPCW